MKLTPITPIRVLFLIRSLNVGGAERQLVELVRRLDRLRFHITVITFYDGGALRSELELLDGVALYSLGKRGRYGWGRPLMRLYKLMRQIRPEVVHGYMGVANELAFLFGRLFGAKVVNGIRASNMNLGEYGVLSRLSFRTGAMVSYMADLVIYNSFSGRDYYQSQGYNKGNAVIIHNGINTEKFRPDDRLRQTLRDEWGIADNMLLIGMVARIDPMKGHHIFLRAARRMIEERPDLRFVCVGDGPAQLKESLFSMSENLGLRDCLVWAGQRTDIPAVHNALDLLVMASVFGEGFPNVVGEAMACGTPAIVTNVGDAGYIVDNPAMVVAVEDDAALARQCLRMLDNDLESLQTSVSKRVNTYFTGECLAVETAKHLSSLTCQ